MPIQYTLMKRFRKSSEFTFDFEEDCVNPLPDLEAEIALAKLETRPLLLNCENRNSFQLADPYPALPSDSVDAASLLRRWIDEEECCSFLNAEWLDDGHSHAHPDSEGEASSRWQCFYSREAVRRSVVRPPLAGTDADVLVGRPTEAWRYYAAPVARSLVAPLNDFLFSP